MAHPNQRQDHRHLDGDSKHAQERSDRPVTKIGEDEFIKQDQILIEIQGLTNRTPNEFTNVTLSVLLRQQIEVIELMPGYQK
jgi:hypothetical protein